MYWNYQSVCTILIEDPTDKSSRRGGSGRHIGTNCDDISGVCGRLVEWVHVGFTPDKLPSVIILPTTDRRLGMVTLVDKQTYHNLKYKKKDKVVYMVSSSKRGALALLSIFFSPQVSLV